MSILAVRYLLAANSLEVVGQAPLVEVRVRRSGDRAELGTEPAALLRKRESSSGRASRLLRPARM
ncbi:MAG: hypothetical protein ACRDRS_09145 [Pseudonocardiaceae bacterium]